MSLVIPPSVPNRLPLLSALGNILSKGSAGLFGSTVTASFDLSLSAFFSCSAVCSFVLLFLDGFSAAELRRSKKPEETLFVVCNFTPIVYDSCKVAVPFAGKYKESFAMNHFIV